MNQTMALPDTIQDRYDTCMKTVSIGKWTDLTILAVRDPDELLDAIDPDDFEGEERSVRAFKVIPQSIPVGCVATYFPEANPLVPARQTARISNTP
ncbi:MAG: hypothetical protein HOH43_11570, partial [Candidatus Latescibacteria bacterium]|nr:hypothetical protein [Candidatus Latescibacterota bacterium]